MKNLFNFLILLLLLGGGSQLLAQGASLNTGQVSVAQPEMFTIVDASSGNQLVWYVESAGISNELGEQVVAVQGDSKAFLLNFLQQYRNNADITTFELDEANNRLTIGMSNTGAQQLFSTLANSLKSSAARH